MCRGWAREEIERTRSVRGDTGDLGPGHVLCVTQMVQAQGVRKGLAGCKPAWTPNYRWFVVFLKEIKEWDNVSGTHYTFVLCQRAREINSILAFTKHCTWRWFGFFFFFFPPSLFLVLTHPVPFSFSEHSFVDNNKSRNFLGHLLRSQFPTNSGSTVTLQAPLIPECSGNLLITRLLGHMLLTSHLQRGKVRLIWAAVHLIVTKCVLALPFCWLHTAISSGAEGCLSVAERWTMHDGRYLGGSLKLSDTELLIWGVLLQMCQGWVGN